MTGPRVFVVAYALWSGALIPRRYGIKITSNPSCGMHIHIPLHNDWELSHSRRRVGSTEIPGVYGHDTQGPHGQSMVQARPRAGDNYSMCGNGYLEPWKKVEEDGAALAISSSKYSWNFIPLVTAKKTIEFRQPHEATNASHISNWITRRDETFELMGRASRAVHTISVKNACRVIEAAQRNRTTLINDDLPGWGLSLRLKRSSSNYGSG
ncbi:hypothetical protein K440DRAFT_645627 [Wilcoxina mikolae CBS 423.85]|nr:hypothetical protein K440DRAFT_645627 [Wilcoxina mikolae CBS 423.85]